MLALMTVLMVLRTAVSVRITRLSGAIGKAVIEGTMGGLLKLVFQFLLSGIPATLLNSTLDYLNSMLELWFRRNLSMYFNRRYLTHNTFFRLAGMHDVDRIDQRVTDDVSNWARVSSAVFMSIVRPLVEALTFTTMLWKRTGWGGPALTWGYYLCFVPIAVVAAPNIDWLANQRLEKEGAFRGAHQELLSYGEEVCESNGNEFEKSLLERLFTEVTNQSRYAVYTHARFNLIEVLYTKYGSVLLGYLVCALAVISDTERNPLAAAVSAGSISGTLAESTSLFQTLAKAIGRFLWNIKLLLAVNGYSQRLYQLVEAIDIAEYEVALQNAATSCSPTSPSGTTLVPQLNQRFGRIVRGDTIEFIDVPLTLPNNETLCSALSFYVKPGMNVLIMGPNGCGKSSTFRLLGELWPLRGGVIVKPEQEQMYYVPQRPYMYDGTLVDQVIYPDKRKQTRVGESELYGHMEMAGLGYIFSKVSWSSHLSWSDDTLSAGEKQRLAMARLFFHRPRFAILDECSSSIDLDVERSLYETCHELGITLITIAHRRSVWQYHNWILHFDGNGGYRFSPLLVEKNGARLVLTRVVSSSNAAEVGQEVVLNVSDLWEDDQTAAQPTGVPASVVVG